MNPKDDPSLASDSATLAVDDEVPNALSGGVAQPATPTPAAIQGPAVGKLHGFDLAGRPIISGLQALPGQLVAARSAAGLRTDMLGRDVVVMFENSDVDRPIILGVMDSSLLQPRGLVPEAPIEVAVDGERCVIEAEREIVLRCGEASITLTRAGKVIIRGTYIMSRSSGYNKIKGAAVDIN